MQNDDFNYDDDDSAPSPQTKSTSPNPSERINKTLTATGIRGEDLVLKCDLDSKCEYQKPYFNQKTLLIINILWQC